MAHDPRNPTLRVRAEYCKLRYLISRFAGVGEEPLTSFSLLTLKSILVDDLSCDVSNGYPILCVHIRRNRYIGDVVSCQKLKLLGWGLDILQGLILEKELP